MGPALAAPLAITLGYGLGSIPFAYLLPRLLVGVDVRTAGSRSVGATNAARVAGAGRRGRTIAVFLAVLALDAAKGSAVIVASRAALDWGPATPLAGAAAILGHVFPVWLGGQGGKGVAVGLGVFGCLDPVATGVALAVTAGTVAATRYMSVGSIVGALALAATHLARAADPLGAGLPMAAFATGAVVLVVWTHRANLARLRAGTENRIGGPRPPEVHPS